MSISLASSEIHRVLAHNIRRIRKQRSFTQEVLAEMAGVNQTHVGNIENFRNSPSVEIIHRLASALGVPISKLFDGEENQPDAGNCEQDTLSDLDRLNNLLPTLRQYQRLASEFGIVDIFQDNGGKLLQTLIITRLRNLPGTASDGVQDAQGNEYGLKTVNQSLTSAFSTHHHLSSAVLAKYRQVNWIFCVYAGIEVVELYLLRPQALETYFSAWEARLVSAVGGSDRALNNPKITIKFIQKVGQLIYKESADGRITYSSEFGR